MTKTDNEFSLHWYKNIIATSSLNSGLTSMLKLTLDK